MGGSVFSDLKKKLNFYYIKLHLKPPGSEEVPNSPCHSPTIIPRPYLDAIFSIKFFFQSKIFILEGFQIFFERG